MLRRPLRTGSGVEERIRAVIAELRPMLHIDPVDVALVSFDDASGTAVLRVEGDCPDCEMSAAMMIEGISAHLRSRVPEIREVRRLDA